MCCSTYDHVSCAEFVKQNLHLICDWEKVRIKNDQLICQQKAENAREKAIVIERGKWIEYKLNSWLENRVRKKRTDNSDKSFGNLRPLPMIVTVLYTSEHRTFPVHSQSAVAAASVTESNDAAHIKVLHFFCFYTGKTSKFKCKICWAAPSHSQITTGLLVAG